MKITFELDDGNKITFDNIVDYKFYDKDDVLQNLYEISEKDFDMDSFTKDTDKINELCKAVKEESKKCDELPSFSRFSEIVRKCAEKLEIIKETEQ